MAAVLTTLLIPPVFAEQVIDLSQLGSGGFRIEGIDAYDRSGWSVSGAGDVNGDGLADLIVGAPYGTAGGDYRAGESYVVFGKPDAEPIRLSAIESGGFRIDGIDSNDYSGRAVSGAGDVNGDGLADLVVGAPRAEPLGHFWNGEVYVIFGKRDTEAVDLTALGLGGFRIGGLDHYDQVGIDVSGAGDVNGDGLADLIVGAYRASEEGRPFSGKSYVVLGKTSSSNVDLETLGSGGFVIAGAARDDHSGKSVAGTGDVNGDGLADVIVGAPFGDPSGQSRAGQSYVVFGKTDYDPVDLLVLGSAGFRIDGIYHYDKSGYSVSGAGDINGDGLADLVVGAPKNDPLGPRGPGESYVIFGKQDSTEVTLSSIGEIGFRITGAAQRDSLGRSISGAGDANGDGLADIMVSAWGLSPLGRRGAGTSYLIFGKPDTSDIDTSNLGMLGVRFDGARELDGSGECVSGAGDVNGDGLADSIIGAPFAFRDGKEEVGESYVLFSPMTASTSAIYKATALAGDAPRIPIGISGDGSNDSTPDSRCWIDFADGSGPGLNGASIQTVTLMRNNDGISGLEDPANVLWRLETNRSEPAATVTFRYLDREIHPYRESDLKLYRADDPAGPWEPVTESFFIDTARNQIGGTVSTLGYFAIQVNSLLAEADFAASPEGWTFAVPTPPFSATMEGSHSVASGALVSTTHDNGNSFGFWESSLIALSPVTPGEELLYQATFTVASDLEDPSLVPTMRLRLSSADFQRSDIISVTSIGTGEFSPGTIPRDYTALTYGSIEQLRLDFDMINVDPCDAANASFALHGARVDLLNVGGLDQEGDATVLDPTTNATAWTTAYDGTGTIAAPVEFLASEDGLLIRGESPAVTQEAPAYTQPVLFGFWNTTIPAPGDIESLYRVRWTVGSDATSRTAVPTFRLRVNDASLQFGSLVVVDSPSEAARVPVDGQDEIYDQWFLLPSEVADNDWLLSFDYLYADTSTNDDPATGLWLRRVEITRLR